MYLLGVGLQPVPAQVLGSEKSQEAGLSLNHVDSKAQTRVIRFGGRCISLRYLTGPDTAVLLLGHQSCGDGVGRVLRKGLSM